MNIISVSSPQFANAANTLIDMTLDTDKVGVIPFTASAADTETRGRDLFARAMALEFGAVAPYIAPIPSAEQIAATALAATRAAELVAVKTDPAVAAMLLLTPTAQAAAIDAMTTLPQLKAEVKRLAMIVNALLKKL